MLRTYADTTDAVGYRSPSPTARWSTAVSERVAPVNPVGRKAARSSCSPSVVIPAAARRPRTGARVTPLCETRQ
jgi:hypothetical protein